MIIVVLVSLSGCKDNIPETTEPIVTSPVAHIELHEGDAIKKDEAEMMAHYQLSLKADDFKIASDKWEQTITEQSTVVKEAVIGKNRRSYVGSRDGAFFYDILSIDGKEYIIINNDGKQESFLVDDPDLSFVGDIDKEQYNNGVWKKILQNNNITNIKYEGSFVYQGKICDVISFDSQETIENQDETFVVYTIEFTYNKKLYSAIYQIDKDGTHIYGYIPDGFDDESVYTWDIDKSTITKDDEIILFTIVDINDHGWYNKEGFEPTVIKSKYVLCIDPDTNMIYKAEIHYDEYMVEIEYNEKLTLAVPDGAKNTDVESASISLMEVLEKIMGQ